MKEIQLEALGYNSTLENYRNENQLDAFLAGRVIIAQRERYTVLTETGQLETELLGNFRFTAESRADFPAVGDWVVVSPYDDQKGLIHAVYPRHSLLERNAVGRTAEKQVIAANIDFGWIVQSLNRDFSLNRLERYVTICHTAGITPVILLSKIDLVEERKLKEAVKEVQERFPDVSVFPFSNANSSGLAAIQSTLEQGKTYCLLGSSGVGKSSLMNLLSGDQLMDTGEINDRIGRGKHVTTHRELIQMPSGALLIDNPGMREVGIADGSSGLEVTFQEIEELAQHCKFKDCTHVNEKGCAILAALDAGELNEEMYENYMKLGREEAHYRATVQERREKEKQFGKMVKGIMKQKKKDKY
ncbi:MAG: ribosome small subunit-dependent GTPase A [Cytophagales bacterium]|nr:ribosome small subunit-dependent GTPase A [Cytophagales bacterium]